MKHIRSCIFVFSIISILLLFNACILITPQTDDDPNDIIEDDQDTVKNDNESADDHATSPTEKPQKTYSPAESAKTPVASNPEVIELFLNEPVSVDLYGDGTAVKLEIADSGDSLVFHAIAGGSERTLSIADIPAGYITNAYYVKSYDSYPYAVVSYDYCSDDYETCVISFSGFEPVESLRLPLYVAEIDVDYFTAYGYIQSAGTWAVATSVYFVRDTIEWRGTYVLDQSAPSYTEMEVARELPVYLWEDGEYKEYSLSPEAPLSFTATDGESYMEFTLWDGTEGYFNFEWDSDWLEIIDGISVYEYFVDLPSYG